MGQKMSSLFVLQFLSLNDMKKRKCIQKHVKKKKKKKMQWLQKVKIDQTTYGVVTLKTTVIFRSSKLSNES